MEYMALIHSHAKRRPDISRVGKRKLDIIDWSMRERGCEEYDLGIMWSLEYLAWVLYAIGDSDKEES